jgi:hypothetical protein
MSSQAQILANQANAKLSTGPSTPEGKSVSSQNATKHGLTGAFCVLPNESQAEFDKTLANYRASHKPQNDHEEFLIAQMVQARWLLARANRQEVALVNQMIAADPEHTGADEVIAAAMLNGKAKPVATLRRYAAAAERSYYKALKELKEGRTAQRKQAGAEVPIEALLKAMEGPVQNEANFALAQPSKAPNPAQARPSLASTLGNLALRL